jgi:hypothetical protein
MISTSFYSRGIADVPPESINHHADDLVERCRNRLPDFIYILLRETRQKGLIWEESECEY